MDFATHNGKHHPINNKPKLESSYLQESESNHISQSKIDKIRNKGLITDPKKARLLRIKHNFKPSKILSNKNRKFCPECGIEHYDPHSKYCTKCKQIGMYQKGDI